MVIAAYRQLWEMHGTTCPLQAQQRTAWRHSSRVFPSTRS
jgi:hypothetical protein